MKALRLVWLAAFLLVIGSAGAGNSGQAAPPDRFLGGQLLAAFSEMKDPRFAESVIYMVMHDDGGA